MSSSLARAMASSKKVSVKQFVSCWAMAARLQNCSRGAQRNVSTLHGVVRARGTHGDGDFFGRQSTACELLQETFNVVELGDLDLLVGQDAELARNREDVLDVLERLERCLVDSPGQRDAFIALYALRSASVLPAERWCGRF